MRAVTVRRARHVGRGHWEGVGLTCRLAWARLGALAYRDAVDVVTVAAETLPAYSAWAGRRRNPRPASRSSASPSCRRAASDGAAARPGPVTRVFSAGHAGRRS